MKTVLFVCIHNSARSQMAEELLRRHCGDMVEVESAGLTPGVMNPLAVAALQEMGIDISKKSTRSVEHVIQAARSFTHVITVCDEASAEQCPVIPGTGMRTHWSFPDPSQFVGTWEEKLGRTRTVRDQIEAKIVHWCKENCAS